jgi:hypothetical protein
MAFRKTQPPNQLWVNSLNVIDVIFHGDAGVIAKWHEFYPILIDPKQAESDAYRRACISMLSEMAKALGYKSLQWTDIDKFYSPMIYAEQAAVNDHFQRSLLSFLGTATALMASGQKPMVGAPSTTDVSVEIIVPDDNGVVSQKDTVSGFVSPPDARVQVLVFSSDGRWYPQTPVTKRAHGRKWQVRATFGNKDSAGKTFRVIALINAAEITQPVVEVPEGAIRSEIVIVTRLTNELTPPPSAPWEKPRP